MIAEAKIDQVHRPLTFDMLYFANQTIHSQFQAKRLTKNDRYIQRFIPIVFTQEKNSFHCQPGKKKAAINDQNKIPQIE